MRRRHCGGTARASTRSENSAASPIVVAKRAGLTSEAASSESARISASAASRSGASQVLDAGLHELARAVAAQAEHRAAIAVGRGASGLGRVEVEPADRDRVLRPQAQLLAREGVGQVEPPAHVLARIEEGGGRLQHRRLAARVAGLDEMRHQRILALAVVGEGKRGGGGVQGRAPGSAPS